MAMGICCAKFCDFVVYTLNGMIITRTPYDHGHFVTLLKKVNPFYKNHMLPRFVSSVNNDDNENTALV